MLGTVRASLTLDIIEIHLCAHAHTYAMICVCQEWICICMCVHNLNRFWREWKKKQRATGEMCTTFIRLEISSFSFFFLNF